MKKVPFFSIIIPVSKDANRKLLKKCLNHLSKQDYKRFEVILVEEAKNNLSKSQARNYGAKTAKGYYLVHIDIDYLLHHSILNKCHDLINQKQARTVILKENVAYSKNIRQKARWLEKEILSQNRFLSTPQVIEKKLFDEIGGFDEEIDELDDWVLNIKLAREEIKSYEISNPLTTVYESTRIIEVIKRRFNKGRYLKPFKEKYGIVSQTAVFPTLKLYWKYLSKFPISLITLTSLLILKFFDLTAFYLGSFFPISPKYLSEPERSRRPNPSNLYDSPSIAKLFDREQKSPYARFKHYLEVKALLNLLPPHTNHHPPITILELGCGTGRITQELIKKGYKVTPTDVSPAMLAEYRNKILSEPVGSSPNHKVLRTGCTSRRPKLPNPTLLKPGKLPYKDNSFDYVVAIRVVWHILDKNERENFLKEAFRVSKKGVILDFAIAGYPTNFKSHDFLIPKEEIYKIAKKYNSVVSKSIFLPLGRIVVKFKRLS